MEFEPAVAFTAVERSCVWIELDEGGGESGGDDIKGVGILMVGGGVGSDVTEWNVHVAIGVEVGEREDVINGEGLV